ncbi:MAG: 3-deoxy-D-manno-octulosonic acid transferase, partial [Planctomycetota bacterium]
MALENRSHPKLPGRWLPLFLDGAYLGGAALAAPVFAVRGKWGRAWESVRRRSGAVETVPSGGPTLWLHSVSVGEILSARRFVARFSELYPHWTLVLSASTRTGLETARRAYPGKTVISFPLDLSCFVRRAFERVRPDMVAIVEHDFWPNFFWRAAKLGVPIAIVNGRISDASFRGYRKIAPVFRGLLGQIAVACAQDEASAARLRALGVPADRVRVTGNVKFDNVPEREPGMRERLGIGPEEWVLVGASTHPGEEAILLDVFDSLRADAAPGGTARLVLVPRRPERAEEVLRLLAERGHRAARWSDLRGGGKPPEGSPVILVDTVGDLDRISSAADLVFVGGSLVPFGGHNVMAPAGMGLPVAIGPHHESFASDVAAFAEREAIAVVRDPGELARVAREFRADPERARGLAERARGLVRELGGASDRALEALEPFFR